MYAEISATAEGEENMEYPEKELLMVHPKAMVAPTRREKCKASTWTQTLHLLN